MKIILKTQKFYQKLNSMKIKYLSMWTHYCKVEKDNMSISKGCTCNWCGSREKNDI